MNEQELQEYLETHYEIVKGIEEIHQKDEIHGKVLEVVAETGTGGLYLLAKHLTDKFHQKYRDICWGADLDWSDTIETFLREELK